MNAAAPATAEYRPICTICNKVEERPFAVALVEHRKVLELKRPKYVTHKKCDEATWR